MACSFQKEESVLVHMLGELDTDVRVFTMPQRGSLSIHIESNVERPRSPGGWRVALARVLLGQVGGVLETTDGIPGSATGFVVRFRFK